MSDHISLSFKQWGTMKHINELHNNSSHFLDWNKARLHCLVQILRALLQVRTVNLTQIAAAEWVEKSIKSNVQDWEKSGWGIFLFFTPDNDFVGSAGLRALVIEGEHVIELMYALMPAFWHQGYGTEMAKACIDDAFNRVGLNELVSFTLL